MNWDWNIQPPSVWDGSLDPDTDPPEAEEKPALECESVSVSSEEECPF